jgi:hypothetical protein
MDKMDCQFTEIVDIDRKRRDSQCACATHVFRRQTLINDQSRSECSFGNHLSCAIFMFSVVPCPFPYIKAHRSAPGNSIFIERILFI